MSTKKLQIVTPIVTSVNGETGDVTLNSIEYTPQTLTDTQKAQARENIGAEEQIPKLRKVTLHCPGLFATTGKDKEFNLWIEKGNVTEYEDSASQDIQGAFNILYMFFSDGDRMSSSNWNGPKNSIKQLVSAIQAGLITFEDSYFICHGKGESQEASLKIINTGSSYIFNVRYSNGNTGTWTYTPSTDSFGESGRFMSLVQSFTGPDSSNQTIVQYDVAKNPTTDMQIATKKYVDDGIAGKADSSHNHSASNITYGTLPITRGGTNASTAAAARTNLGFSYGTSVPTSAPVTGNGAVFFCQDSGSPLSIANGGTGGATQDAARTNLGLPTQDRRVVNICNGTRLVTGSNITITLDPTEAKKYSAILILLGTPLGGNYGNMYDSFVFPLNPDTWSFRFFKYTLEGQDWQCAKANLSSDWTTFTITAVSGDTNHPCWCYLM